MTDQASTPLYTLGPEEKIANVMIYLPEGLCWGEVIVKNQIRVSTWLRTNAAPDTISLFNARYLLVTNAVSTKPILFPEIHIHASQILAIHLVPPARDPLDYDPSEPNRRMEPLTILVGFFRFNGFIRLAGKTTLAKYLEITREQFTPIYDAHVSCLALPSLATIKVPFLLVRQSTSYFATRSS